MLVYEQKELEESMTVSSNLIKTTLRSAELKLERLSDQINRAGGTERWVQSEVYLDRFWFAISNLYVSRHNSIIKKVWGEQFGPSRILGGEKSFRLQLDGIPIVIYGLIGRMTHENSEVLVSCSFKLQLGKIGFAHSDIVGAGIDLEQAFHNALENLLNLVAGEVEEALKHESKPRRRR